jgi:hypothetical protein
MFAGNDARQFSPLVDKIISRLDHLKEPGTWSDLASVKKRGEVYRELSKFDLGIQLICYGSRLPSAASAY